MDFLLSSVTDTADNANWDARVEKANMILGELPPSQPQVQLDKETDIFDAFIS